MGKKKVFIDKKKAVTYSLVYRDASEDADGDDGGQRVLVSVGKPQYPASDIPNCYDDEGSVYDSEYSLDMSRCGVGADGYFPPHLARHVEGPASTCPPKACTTLLRYP